MSLNSFDFSKVLESEPLTHFLIVGSTGTGKTNDSKLIAYEAASRGFSVIVFDPKGEYEDVARAVACFRDAYVLGFEDEPRFYWNPLQCPSFVNPTTWAKTFSDVLVRSYGLGEPSRRILYDSIYRLYVRHGVFEGSGVFPTLRELELEVSRFRARSRSENDSRVALCNRLHIVGSGLTGDCLCIPRGYRIEDFEGKFVVIRLDSIPSVRDQRFIVELFLAMLWERQKALLRLGKQVKRFLIVLEEAHRYVPEERSSIFRGERTVIELAVAEGRSCGLLFVVVDQMLSLLSRYVVANCGVKVVHRLESWVDIGVAMRVLGVVGSDLSSVERIYSMRTGEALVSFPGFSSGLSRVDCFVMRKFVANNCDEVNRGLKSRRDFIREELERRISLRVSFLPRRPSTAPARTGNASLHGMRGQS